MSEATHQLLWRRVRAALAARGVLPSGHPTVDAIARHAKDMLNTDLVLRFVDEYYNARSFGNVAGDIDDVQAEALVVRIEKLLGPAATGGPAARSASAQIRVQAPPASTQTPSDDSDEALAYNSPDTASEKARERAARIERDKVEEEARRQQAEKDRLWREAKRQEDARALLARQNAAEKKRLDDELAAAQKRRDDELAAEKKRQDEARAAELKAAAEALAKDRVRALLDRAAALSNDGDYRGALPLLDEALRLDPQASTWHDLGYARGELGEHRQAMEAYQEALRLDAGRKVSWNNLAFHQLELDKLEDAERSARRGLSVDASYAPLWYNLGRLYEKKEDFPKAAEALSQAVRFAPSNYLYSHQWGLFQSKAGDRAGAVAAYLRALELSPRAAVTWSNLGAEYCELGDLAQAEASLIKAIELDASMKNPRDWLDLVRAKRGEPPLPRPPQPPAPRDFRPYARFIIAALPSVVLTLSLSEKGMKKAAGLDWLWFAFGCVLLSALWLAAAAVLASVVSLFSAKKGERSKKFGSWLLGMIFIVNSATALLAGTTDRDPGAAFLILAGNAVWYGIVMRMGKRPPEGGG